MVKKLDMSKFNKSDKFNMTEKMPLISLGIFVAVSVVMILVSYLVLNIPIVPVCTIVILEALLCALLNQIPVWVHGIIVIAQVVAGVLFAKVVFMVLMAIVYVVAVALLYIWTKKN